MKFNTEKFEPRYTYGPSQRTLIRIQDVWREKVSVYLMIKHVKRNSQTFFELRSRKSSEDFTRAYDILL